MSESNNNTPMRITQLEEATSYPEGSYIPIAKAGYGTKRINTNIQPLFDRWLNISPCQFIDTNNIITGKYYGHGNLSLTDSASAVILNYVFHVEKDKTYYYENIYAFFSNVLYDDGSIQALSDSSSNFNGSFTPSQNGTMYITIPFNGGVLDARFYNTENKPESKKIGFFDDTLPLNINEFDKVFKQAELQLLSYDTSLYTFGEYYNHNSINTVSSSSACILKKPIRIYKGITYTYKFLYAYFCNIIYDNSSTATAISNSTAPNMSGEFTAENDGYLYITLAVSSGSFLYDSEIIQNYKDINNMLEIYPDDSDIIQKLLDNKGKNIHFNDGNYDIISMYETHFGNDYFTNYSGYSSGGNNLGAGLPVYRNTKMTFSTGAKFTANYTGDNSAVRNNFACFWLESGVTFDGLRIEASGVRNVIHDDFDNQYSATTTIQNCHFKHDSSIIAGGLAVHDTVIIKNNYFECTHDDLNFDFHYHNNGAASAQSTFIIKDNYLNKGISLRYYGSSTAKTDVLITNNSMAYDVEYRAEASATVDNMTLRKWNNELRS